MKVIKERSSGREPGKKKSINGSILTKMEEPAEDFALKNEVCQASLPAGWKSPAGWADSIHPLMKHESPSAPWLVFVSSALTAGARSTKSGRHFSFLQSPSGASSLWTWGGDKQPWEKGGYLELGEASLYLLDILQGGISASSEESLEIIGSGDHSCLFQIWNLTVMT